ncbi:hypothetical protein ACTAQJ_08000 [Arthrobacter sp. alpha11c]
MSTLRWPKTPTTFFVPTETKDTMHRLRTYRPAAPSAQPFISTSLYISLEIKRHLETTETPGVHGYFGEVTE